MAKRNAKSNEAMAEETKAIAIEATQAEPIEPSLDEDDSRPNSVVGLGYKAEYRARALARGRNEKHQRRCNGDWLANELAARCLDEDERLVVPTFEAILDENGVQHAHWNRTTNGWQGRLRMSGSMSLRAKLKKQGWLVMGGERVEAPKAQPIQAAE